MGQMTFKRKAPAASIVQLVMHEAGYHCANPACRMILTLDIHHMEYVSEGGGDTPENLLPLCPNCHSLHHKGEIPRESIRAWKMLLLALNEAYDRRAVDLLLMLDKMQNEVIVSGDGLLQYAPLIASELVTQDMMAGEFPNGVVTASYHVQLTAKGKAFVAAWKAGDQKLAIAGLPPAPNC